MVYFSTLYSLEIAKRSKVDLVQRKDGWKLESHKAAGKRGPTFTGEGASRATSASAQSRGGDSSLMELRVLLFFA